MNQGPLQLENVSIVVLSESNNPSLLNPDFLAGNGIVPGSWSIQQVLVTPPIAMVSYTNGVTITVEEKKLQITAARPAEINWQSELARIAVTYLTILKHVHYQSVGLNIVMTRATSTEPDKAIVNNILQKGPWLEFGNGISGTEVKFQYAKSQPTLQIAIQGASKTDDSGTQQHVFLFTANFHHEFNIEQVTERNRFINELSKHENELRELVGQIPLDLKS
ncbi:MAG: hypothetical protein ACC651_17565 [Candidatus Scalindua sp.]